MKVIESVWKVRDAKFSEPRTGFGICRLLETMRHAGDFIPTKDFLRVYSAISDLRLGDITDELVSEMTPELTTYYNTAVSARIHILKDMLLDKVKLGIQMPAKCKELFEDYKNATNATDKDDAASDLRLQVEIDSHNADKIGGVPNGDLLTADHIETIVSGDVNLCALIALVKLCFVSPEMRSLTRVPNASTRENAVHEYLQQNLLSRFAEKTHDEPTTGVSRACSSDIFTLSITTKETAGLDHGRPRSKFDMNYRILCDIYSGH